MKMKRWLGILLTLAMLFSMTSPVYAMPGDLITNGDFEAGNTGFTSGYTPVTAIYQNSLQPPLVYAIGTSPNLYHSAWLNFGDHTSGTGKMMIVNGTTTEPPAIVWGQDVTDLTPDPADPQSFPLYAGKSNLVGEVLVKSDGTNICVKFVLSEDAIAVGWIIAETHVAVADVAAGIPQMNGNPTPGKFPEGEKLDPGVTETDWYCLPIGAGWSAPDVVAAHAVVKKIQAGYTVYPDCLVSGTGSEAVTLLAEDGANPGYPVGYTAGYQTTYPAGATPILAWTHSAWGPYGIAGANWISSAYYSETPDYNTWRLFTRSIDIPAAATNISATLTMNADNAEVAYINGDFVGDGSPAIVYGSSPAIGGGRHGYDSIEGPINIDLNAGPNKLWIMTRNYGWAGGSQANPTALIYKLCYQYDMPPTVIQTETAWGGTDGFTGKNWATYINYTPKEPISPTYTLTFYAKSSYADPAPGQLEVSINEDTLTPAVLNLGTAAAGWTQYTATWSAGIANHANIEIRDIRIAYTGNDFCIDDISFVKN